MKMGKSLVGRAALACGLLAMSAAPAAFAQQPGTENGGRGGATSGASGNQQWTAEQLVTASCREAWQLSGRSEEKFADMVTQLMQISEQKRKIDLPESKEAGIAAGNYIKTHAKADPDQLLYVVVDQAVQRSAKRATTAAAKSSSKADSAAPQSASK